MGPVTFSSICAFKKKKGKKKSSFLVVPAQGMNKPRKT